MVEQRDIFLCHASEDKPNVVRELIKALDNNEITYWYDEAEIKWGDSIIQKVNEGLKVSRYVIVILSSYFISKNWPQRELNSALNIEASSGKIRVLPLLVGSKNIRKEIIEKYPILNDKLFLQWDNNTDAIINALKSRLSIAAPINLEKTYKDKISSFEIPIPKIKKKFSQRDKDIFLKKAFNIIKIYFKEALEQLQIQTKVETDFTEINNYNFIATIYINGEIGKRCKIWIGGPLPNAIAYREGEAFIDSDNTCNGWFNVSNNDNEIGLEASGIWFNTSNFEKDQLLSPENAAKNLWQHLTEYLG